MLAVNPELTAETAAKHGFVARGADAIPAWVANLRKAGLP